MDFNHSRPVSPSRRRRGITALRWLGWTWPLLLCVAGNASPAAPPASARQAFISAMSNGDAKAAIRIAKQDGAGPFWIELYRDQLRYRLPALMSSAKACRDDAMRDGGPAAMGDATDCNGFILESTQAMGDAHGYFEALAWHRDHGVKTWKAGHSSRKSPLLLPKADAAKLARSVPAFSVELTSTAPVSLPYANLPHPSGTHHSDERKPHRIEAGLGEAFTPKLDVTINGHHVKALVDTGTSTALVMSLTQAKALGLQPLVTGLSGFRSLGKPPIPAGSKAVYLATSLELGPLHVHNVMVIVIPDDYEKDTDVTIGLPLLARFDNVVFNQSGMIVNAPSAACRHALPVTYAALSGHDGILVFAAEADGKPIRAMIDTGAPSAMIVGPRLMPDAASGVTAAHGGSLSGHFRFIRIRLGGLGALDLKALMLSDMPENLDVDFGFPLSWSWPKVAAVRFDFTNMSICLVGLSTGSGGQRP